MFSCFKLGCGDWVSVDEWNGGRVNQRLRVAALTSGKAVPSSRFRVRQHLAGLADLGLDVREYCPGIDKYRRFPGFSKGISQKWLGPVYPLWMAAKLASRFPGILGSWQRDITWLERNIYPGLITAEYLLRRPFVFDVDDAIWCLSETSASSARRIAQKANLVVAGNDFIANWFQSWNPNVVVIPTSVDDQRYRPSQIRSGDRFRIGWIGTAKNLKYLEAIEPPLRVFLQQNPNAELVVVSDAQPNLSLGDRARFIAWTEEQEVELIQSFSVGLMPLPDSDWARGKCSFKMLQYMACGVPVIVSPVGMNKEVLLQHKPGLPATSSDDWLEALVALMGNQQLALECGMRGRESISRYFSLRVITPKIADALMRCSGRSEESH